MKCVHCRMVSPTKKIVPLSLNRQPVATPVPVDLRRLVSLSFPRGVRKTIDGRQGEGGAQAGARCHHVTETGVTPVANSLGLSAADAVI